MTPRRERTTRKGAGARTHRVIATLYHQNSYDCVMMSVGSCTGEGGGLKNVSFAAFLRNSLEQLDRGNPPMQQ
jgi:hypothetical protein